MSNAISLFQRLGEAFPWGRAFEGSTGVWESLEGIVARRTLPRCSCTKSRAWKRAQRERCSEGLQASCEVSDSFFKGSRNLRNFDELPDDGVFVGVALGVALGSS